MQLNRFNEAPSWFSGKFYRISGATHHSLASMRPRVGSRGSKKPKYLHRGLGAASMRPRVGSRGSR